MDLLARTRIDSLFSVMKGGRLVTVNKQDSIPDVLQVLSKNNILAAPVLDENGKLFGIVDMLDIITFTVGFIEHTHELPSRKSFEQYLKDQQANVQPIASIIGLSKPNKLVTVRPDSSLMDVMQRMRNQGVERVVVVDAAKIQNVVTQSAIVRYISSNLYRLGTFGDRNISEIGFAPKNVISVKETANMIDAFRAVSQNRVSGIPILDTNGGILTNISCRDLRDLLCDSFLFDMMQITKAKITQAPIERFVSEFKSRTFMKNADTMYPRICCKTTSRFVDVVNKLAATRIHRMYVVDANEHPIGVISLHDIICQVAGMFGQQEGTPVA